MKTGVLFHQEENATTHLSVVVGVGRLQMATPVLLAHQERRADENDREKVKEPIHQFDEFVLQ